MSEPSLRDALLDHNGGSSVDAELAALNALLQSEERRRRRLRFWTITVWAVWLGMVIALVVGYPMAAVTAPAPQKPPAAGPLVGQPHAAPGPAPLAGIHPVAGFVLLVGILIFMAGSVSLPVVGLVLLILLLLDRRPASMSQIRTSLASIEEKLKLLALAGKTPSGPQG
ncbi:MAG TPA: hypothetical protein VGZ22_03575 [Isosphaeraceae bacterium]|jgi:hypothetical protein|nr:hypothetical protein [Isosphaeraceae bacterium]